MRQVLFTLQTDFWREIALAALYLFHFTILRVTYDAREPKLHKLTRTEDFQAHVIRQPGSTCQDISASGG
jgi:hypothetical protein